MSTFHDLVRGQPDVQKSRDDESRYYTPPEALRRYKAALEENPRPGTAIILDSLRRKEEQARRPAHRGTELLDRQTTFVDLLQANVRGLDVRQRDHYDEWQERISEEQLADWLAELDDEEPTKTFDDAIKWANNYIEKAAGNRTINVPFKKVIPITKAYEKNGDLYIEGESSGPEIDLDKQFMTPECIQDMARQVNKVSVPFGYYDEHNKRGVMSELGKVVEANVTPEYHMKVRVRLDRDNPAATLLWKKVKRGKRYGMSIAGYVLEAVKKTIDGMVYQGFNQLRLDHIANTIKPSWMPSLGTLVAKSLEQIGFNWADAREYEALR